MPFVVDVINNFQTAAETTSKWVKFTVVAVVTRSLTMHWLHSGEGPWLHWFQDSQNSAAALKLKEDLESAVLMA